MLPDVASATRSLHENASGHWEGEQKSYPWLDLVLQKSELSPRHLERLVGGVKGEALPRNSSSYSAVQHLSHTPLHGSQLGLSSPDYITCGSQDKVRMCESLLHSINL